MQPSGTRGPTNRWTRAALIAHALFYQLNVVGMLVYDMQHLLARYEPRLNLKGSGSEEIFDVVSGEFVTCPEHFLKLHDRLRNLLYLAQAGA